MAPRANRHRSTLSLQKTEITIHVYDLLPPGKLSSVLWTVGASLLHSGVVINGKEYAYGGHGHPGQSGVYWHKPRMVPPGGTFKTEILHGFTLATDEEIQQTIMSAAEAFQGTAYNLLTRNCNHWTSYVCEKLTGTPAPAWLNRAASIGVAMPCVLPRQWVEPPEYESAEGVLVGEDDEDTTDERAGMLGGSAYGLDEMGEEGHEAGSSGSGSRKQPVLQDAKGRNLPAAERAPNS